jgi:hypothetical protein
MICAAGERRPGAATSWRRPEMRRMFWYALVVLFTVLPGDVCVAQPAPLSGDAVDRMLLIDQRPSGRGGNEMQSAELRLRLAQGTSRNALVWFVLGMCFHLFAVLTVLFLNSHSRPATADV